MSWEIEEALRRCHCSECVIRARTEKLVEEMEENIEARRRGEYSNLIKVKERKNPDLKIKIREVKPREAKWVWVKVRVQ